MITWRSQGVMKKGSINSKINQIKALKHYLEFQQIQLFLKRVRTPSRSKRLYYGPYYEVRSVPRTECTVRNVRVYYVPLIKSTGTNRLSLIVHKEVRTQDTLCKKSCLKQLFLIRFIFMVPRWIRAILICQRKTSWST